VHVRCGAAGGHSIRVVLPGVTLYDGELWVPLEGVERVVARWMQVFQDSRRVETPGDRTTCFPSK
jgi:hypothetical protein